MTGHMSKACRNRTCQTDPPLKMSACQKTAIPKTTSNTVKQIQTLPINDVEEGIDSNSDEDSSFFYIHKINPTKPLCVTLGIQDSTIKFEIDTGSGITLISERALHAFSKPTVSSYKNKSSNLCKRTTQGIRKINHQCLL